MKLARRMVRRGMRQARVTVRPLTVSLLDFLAKQSLEGQWSGMRNWGKLSQQARISLEPTYRKYVTCVSSDDMAISLQLGTFLLVLCQLVHPKRILDLGSGFSSVVFRKWQSMVPDQVEVLSIDDNVEWLDKTTGFLAQCGLSLAGLQTWDRFIGGKDYNGSFDMVLHDLGNMEMRTATLRLALNCSSKQGIAILDDMHKQNYATFVIGTLRELRYSALSLRPFTLDHYGRFAALARRRK